MAEFNPDYFWTLRDRLKRVDFFLHSHIEKSNEAVRKFANNPENAERLRKFTEEYRRMFVHDCDYTNPEGKEETESISAKQQRRQYNITETISEMFGDALVTNSLKMDFGVNLAKQLSVKIGEGIIDNAGDYRKDEVRPESCDYYYLQPDCIENDLNQLFKYINQPIEPGRYDGCDVATEFLDRFLFIRPFKDDNETVARFLLSALLVNYSVVPVCLMWRDNADKLYADALRQAHDPKIKNRKRVKSFLIDALRYTLYSCTQGLKIEVYE